MLRDIETERGPEGRRLVCTWYQERNRDWRREKEDVVPRESKRSKGACATGAHLARKLLSRFFGTVVDISVGGLIPTAVVSATNAPADRQQGTENDFSRIEGP